MRKCPICKIHTIEAISQRGGIYCSTCDRVWVKINGKLKPKIRKGKVWVYEKVNKNKHRRKRI